MISPFDYLFVYIHFFRFVFGSLTGSLCDFHTMKYARVTSAHDDSFTEYDVVISTSDLLV